MNKTPTLESVMALNDRIFAMLTPSEVEVLEFYRNQGGKFGVAVCIINQADVAELAKSTPKAAGDEVVRSANSIVSVQVIHQFVPGKTKETPFIAKVEMLLGGIPQLMFPDGTQQFADQDSTPVVVYSPQLPELELEAFCRENIERYEQHYAQHKRAIDEYETPAIVPFW